MRWDYSIRVQISLNHMKKGSGRREGKGRRCCQGDRNASIPYRTSYF